MATTDPPTKITLRPSSLLTEPTPTSTLSPHNLAAGPTPSSTIAEPPTTHPTYPPPPLSFIKGTWHVTHSTLPMWKTNRNIRIKYTPVPNSGPDWNLHDEVTYQALHSGKFSGLWGKGGAEKVKSIVGVDRPLSLSSSSQSPSHEEKDNDNAEDKANLTYTWRGSGMLTLITSQWEILGYGHESGTGNAWVVTFFAKTLFTPWGLDIYSKDAKGLKDETVQEIKRALGELGGEVARLAGEVFEVVRDGGRDGGEGEVVVGGSTLRGGH